MILKGFKGNLLIRKAGVPPEGGFTPDRINEIVRCATDHLYFFRKYVKIKHVDYEKKVLFDPRGYQLKMLKSILANRNTISRWPRQSGKTTVIAAVALHYMVFQRNYSILIAAHKGDKAQDIIAAIQDMYMELPSWLQQGVAEWNKRSFKLENGSRVRSSTTSTSSARGDTYNCISGNSRIRIRLNRTYIVDITIGDLFSYLDEDNNGVSTEQIHQMVLLDHKTSTKPKIRRTNLHRKTSYNAQKYGWDQREREHCTINGEGTSYSSSSFDQNGRRRYEAENGVCLHSDDERSSGTTIWYEEEGTTTLLQRNRTITQHSFNWSQALRNNKRKDATKFCSAWKTLSETCKGGGIESQHREISQYQEKQGIWGENISSIEGTQKISGMGGEDQSQSRENSQNSRKTQRNETFGRSKEKNEPSQKGQIYSLEQRIKEAKTIEVLTEEGFRTFSGVSCAKKDTIKISYDNNHLYCTNDHGIKLADGEWVKAETLKKGDVLYFGQTVSNVIIGEEQFVYDLLSVDFTYAFIANDVLVSNCIMLDEFAFVAEHVAEAFVKSVIPTVSSGKDTKIIVTSTPKGLNYFYKLWAEAVKVKDDERKSDDFIPIAVEWNEVPGRDEVYRDAIIKKFGQEFWDQEFACAFLGSSLTLISAAKLLTLVAQPPLKETDDSRLYALPVKDHIYAMTVDVAEGLGGDFSAISVFDVTIAPYKQVYIYQNRYIDPMALPSLIAELGKRYNNAMALVESNFGQLVGDILWRDYQYEHVIFTERAVKIPGGFKVGWGGRKQRPGVQMNPLAKRIGCSTLKSLIENDQLIVEDEKTIEELRRFAVKGKSYAAENGNDDLVMTLVLFGWLSEQGYVKAQNDVNVRATIAQLNQKRIDDNMLVAYQSNHQPDSSAPIAVKGNDDRWLWADENEAVAEPNWLADLERWERHGSPHPQP